MVRPSWWKAEITPGNVVSWLLTVGTVITFVVMIRSDVNALQSAKVDADKRFDKIEGRANIDRDNIADIKGDIRVIRQILESRR